MKEGAKEEDWAAICRKFNDDVTRISDVTDQGEYTGLFECFDNANVSFFYLVKEDKNLYRMKHRHFLGNLGLK